MQAIRFGIDLAKNVFQVHGVDAAGRVVVQRQLRRAQVEKFFAAQPPALIGMEACGSAHHWARTLSALGHDVKLMPPAYVKPYVQRNKNDARDAHGCCEAVSRPDMRFVPIKSVEQQWARALHRTRDLLVRQRTQLANAMRGLLYEMGQTSAKGAAGIETLLRRVEAADEAIPAALLICLVPLAGQWRALDGEIGKLDKQILAQVRQQRAALRLTTIPSVGPIIAHATVAAIGDGRQFASARDFAAWLGLTRKTHDTGGKHRPTGHISRAGDKDLRRLLILGASSWLRQVRAKPDRGSPWIRGLLARRPVKVAVVAQAAKTARIIWAMLQSGQQYRAPAVA
ncbi:IS110 family transposase [Mesorhizobium sp. M2A.F.Ca.ET.043.05.1.1]|uniref:IS110 family transposase n=1 Tax=Mesorhizobium sp. M2A.F.Ca.ET.043.05.1.1 TaxID=2493671 RepID=UPI000F761717|nr:IS110 family transposase [Mesorhizobium sp. M2A.F.Ca.ET.043.05.1.1]AZO16799.1 IS110 family transposase [Mesorhizobium sp. M2A.F.Ca.ET.043.05.1.1]